MQHAQNQTQNQLICEIFNQISKEIGEKKLKYDPENLCQIYNELKSKDYLLTGFIGSGGEAPVFEARKDGNFVAVKCLRVDRKVKIDKEMEMVKRLQEYPFIHQYLDGFYSSDNRYFFYVTEKLQCDLKQILDNLKQKGQLPLSNIIVSFLQMASSLYALEVEGLSHFDIKPDNFLYDVEAECFKLSDYGLSKQIQIGNSCTKSVDGVTIKYAAPEIWKQLGEYNIKTDIYSLGLVFLELTIGRLLTLDEAIQIRLNNLDLDKFFNNNIQFKELNRIIQQMLNIERKDRISPRELVWELIKLKDEHISSLKSLLSLELDWKFIEIIYNSYQYFSDSLKNIAWSNFNNTKKFDQLSGIIYIHTLTNDTLNIETEFYQTIQSIKAKIQDTQDILPNDYQLTLNYYSQLAEKESLFGQNIKNRSKLYMASNDHNYQNYQKEKNIKILVKTLTGRKIKIEDITILDSIKDLKYKIYSKEDIQIDQQILIFESKKLEDSILIKNLNIQNESIFHLIQRFRSQCFDFQINFLSGYQKIITFDYDSKDYLYIISDNDPSFDKNKYTIMHNQRELQLNLSLLENDTQCRYGVGYIFLRQQKK